MERLEIKSHPKMLYDVIERQAGTLSKALLEAVQNSLEAATDPTKAVVDITYESNGVAQYQPGATIRIFDNGKGIISRREINDYFLTFGTPHTEAENKTWAQFRMGRGQIFSYGKNTWRTSTFRMFVDIAKDKAAEEFPHCELEDDLPPVDGCQIEIELYKNPVGEYGYTVDALKDELRKQLEFMPGIIRFNGEQLNTPPEKLKWTEEDDDAYYLFNKGGDLSIYNMGAYVMSMSPTRAGVTGVIVSKTMLKVNFARNAVQEDSCPVWARIREVIKANRIKKTRQAARRLNSNERTATLLDLRDGNQDMEDLRTIGLFETCNGRVLTSSDIRKNTLPWCFAEAGDRLADKLLVTEQALCINEDVLDALSYRGQRKDFFYWLASKCSDEAESWKKVAALYKEFDSLTVGQNRTSTIIPHAKMTRVEKRAVKVLESMPYWGGRRILIGVSGCNALAWTDGSTYIALNRDYLEKLSLTSYTGPADLIHTMFHEAAHDEDTAGTHHHGEEFYRRFHDITYRHSGSWGCPLQVIGTFYQKMRNAATAEYQEKMEAREKKSKEAKEKALGLEAARTQIASQVEEAPVDEVESEAAPVKVVVKKSRRKLPRALW